MKHSLFLLSLLLSFTLSAQLQDCDITSHYWEVLDYNPDTDKWESGGEWWGESHFEVRPEFLAFRWEEDKDFAIQWWNFEDKPNEDAWRYFTEKGNCVIFHAEDQYILNFINYDEELKTYTKAFLFTKLDIDNID